MSDRIDELKGNVKAGAGKLTGDEHLESKGDAEATVAKARRETKGAAREVAGKLKEGIGTVTDNERLEAEGKAERLRGKAEQAGEAPREKLADWAGLGRWGCPAP